VPHVGRMIQWLRRPVVHTTTVIVVPMLLALAWIVSIWRGDRTTPTISSA